MSAAVPLYRRTVYTCGTCKDRYDEVAFKALRKLCPEELPMGVTIWWAECACGSGAVAVERAKVWLTEAESVGALMATAARGGK